MKIAVTSVLVDDQAKALAFYRDVLGFELRHDIPMGEHRWLTLVSPGDPDGVELLLEPDARTAAKPFKAPIKQDGIPSPSSRSTMCRRSMRGFARPVSVSPDRRLRRERSPLPSSTAPAAISSRSSSRIEPLTAPAASLNG